ncbi:MAG: hypothetical protein JHC31_01300 [Sulfurihydrogenibium sp.]|nr:hypothetical protein [Sulfurihydrogenibium sp.]
MTKTKFVLTMLGAGVIISLFKIQAIHYQKQIEDLQKQLADMQIQNKVLQSDLNECKQFKTKADKLVAELLKDYENFKNQ